MNSPSGHADTWNRVMDSTIIGRRNMVSKLKSRACDLASLSINAAATDIRLLNP